MPSAWPPKWPGEYARRNEAPGSSVGHRNPMTSVSSPETPDSPRAPRPPHPPRPPMPPITGGKPGPRHAQRRRDRHQDFHHERQRSNSGGVLSKKQQPLRGTVPGGLTDVSSEASKPSASVTVFQDPDNFTDVRDSHTNMNSSSDLDELRDTVQQTAAPLLAAGKPATASPSSTLISPAISARQGQRSGDDWHHVVPAPISLAVPTRRQRQSDEEGDQVSDLNYQGSNRQSQRSPTYNNCSRIGSPRNSKENPDLTDPPVRSVKKYQ